MTDTEYMLAYIIEECAEVSEQADKIVIRASKALRFGLDEVQAEQLLTNAQRLWGELADLMAVGELALDLGIITRDDLDRKKEKVEKYKEMSRRLGRLDA
jgi:NTP pyrophosphatase (non-canonical NTP hydrolase)